MRCLNAYKECKIKIRTRKIILYKNWLKPAKVRTTI